MLLPEQNKLADSSSSRRSILRTVLTIVIIAGLAWLLFTVVRDLIVYGLYFRYVDELAAKTGLNQYLINALAALGLAPFLLGFKYYFFSLSKEKRMRGAAMLLGMTFLYNMALYVATKDEVMGKVYTITAEGVRFSDRILDDGREWKKITRNNEWYVTHLTVGKKVDAAGHDWFDQKSGLPLLWYSKLDKEIQFYDGPGFDRFTAEELKPVTKELYLEWKRSAQSHAPASVSRPQSIAQAFALEPLLALIAKCQPSEFDTLERVAAAYQLYQEKGTAPWTASAPCWGTKIVPSSGAQVVTLQAPVGEWSAFLPAPAGMNFTSDWFGSEERLPHQIEFTTMDGETLVITCPSKDGKNQAIQTLIRGFRVKALEKPVIIKFVLSPK